MRRDIMGCTNYTHIIFDNDKREFVCEHCKQTARMLKEVESIVFLVKFINTHKDCKKGTQ